MTPGTEYRTIGAALDARDILRARIVPAANRLRAVIGAENREAHALLDEIRSAAGSAADRLRRAIKNRRG